MRSHFMFGAALVVGFLGVTGIASAAPPGTGLTCTGGVFTGDPSTSTFVSIPSGTYSSLTIAGVCNVVPGAVINVTGDITVAPGALFDAQSAPSTIYVKKDVTAGAGSFLGLGCLPDGAHAGHPCATDPTGHTTITVGGRADYQYSANTYFFYAPLFIPIVILGVPIIDTAFSVVRRCGVTCRKPASH